MAGTAVKVEEDIHKKLKMHSFKSGFTMKQIVEASVSEHLSNLKKKTKKKKKKS